MKKILVFLSLVICLIGLSSCGDRDEDEGSEPNTPEVTPTEGDNDGDETEGDNSGDETEGDNSGDETEGNISSSSYTKLSVASCVTSVGKINGKDIDCSKATIESKEQCKVNNPQSTASSCFCVDTKVSTTYKPMGYKNEKNEVVVGKCTEGDRVLCRCAAIKQEKPKEEDADKQG